MSFETLQFRHYRNCSATERTLIANRASGQRQAMDSDQPPNARRRRAGKADYLFTDRHYFRHFAQGSVSVLGVA